MIQPDLYLPYPGAQTIASCPEASLVREFDGVIGLVDHRREHIFRLNSDSYALGLGLMMTRWPSTCLGVYRSHIGDAIGFWLGKGAILIAEFEPGGIPPIAWMPYTRIIVSPGSLHLRYTPGETWDHLLWTNWSNPPQH